MRYWQYVVQIGIIISEVLCTLAQEGEWSKWSQWSQCSVSCGYGIQKRDKSWRSANPRGSNTDTFTYSDIMECFTNTPCPTDGKWSFWAAWSECTHMCDGGTTTRYRECNSPKPQNGGKFCDGKNFAETTCNEWTCPPLPPNFDITKCNSTTFMCKSRLQCIVESHVCDDSLQCHDGSDEYDCDTYNWTSGATSVTFSVLFIAIVTFLRTVIPL